MDRGASRFLALLFAARLQAVLADGLLSRSDRATLVRAYAQDLALFADQVAQAAQLPSSQCTQARSLGWLNTRTGCMGRSRPV